MATVSHDRNVSEFFAENDPSLRSLDTNRSVPQAGQLAVVQFFDKGRELEGAQNMIDDLQEHGFNFTGIQLLVATKKNKGSYNRKDVMHSHACTAAVADAISELEAGPSTLVPIYPRRLVINASIPYGQVGYETPEELRGYGIGEHVQSVSKVAASHHAQLLDPLLGWKPEGVRQGLDALRSREYTDTGLILMTDAQGLDSFTTIAARLDHVATEPLAGGVVIADIARLHAVV